MTPKEILKQYWGYDTFRPLQEEIIQSVMAGNDTLALMPTGGGKSVCFQVPAMLRQGICIVVSPLIALMKDQVYQLHKKGINAKALISGMRFREMDITLQNCSNGQVKFLYVSPERLTTDLFIERVKAMNVNLLAVDEAHCISQWGYDFRPPYLQIAEVRQYMPGVSVLALTASATPRVENDIIEKLNFVQPVVHRKSFERKNISFVVTKTDNKPAEILKILKAVPGTAIIYVRSRIMTGKVAGMLNKQGISADYYHAGLSTPVRTQKQMKWLKNQTRVMVCTNAFGMGIDKPDVRTVIHLGMPDSLEAYYQEAGRAGRDDRRSYAVLLFDDSDMSFLTGGIEKKFPSTNTIRQVYHALCQHLQIPEGGARGASFDFDIKVFVKAFELDMTETYHAIKVLEHEGYIATTDAVYLSSRLKIVADRATLYELEVKSRKMENLIKLILRSYEGAMDHYVKIDEKTIARRLGKSPDEIKRDLNTLQRSGMLYYEPVNDKPQVIFLSERVGRKNLEVDNNRIKELKTIYKDQVQAVAAYVENNFKCRSRELIGYFGEINTIPCDHCDVCIKRNKIPLKADEMEKITVMIHSALAEKPASLQELTNGKPKSDAEKILQVSQWLCDTGQIEIIDFNKMKWVD